MQKYNKSHLKNIVMNKTIYRSGNRLCVHFQTLIPKLNFHDITKYLREKGYEETCPNIVLLAREQLGKKYKRGSKPNEETFDCSSLTKYVYGKMGIYIPRISIDQCGQKMIHVHNHKK
jgi:hypothetical protein